MEECMLQLCTEGAKFDGEWKWQAAGMSYLLRTENNRLIAIDGGETEADARHLLEKARELTGEAVPTVALWIITHPHGDHYGAMWQLSRNERERAGIRVEAICYQQFDDAVLPRTGVSFRDDEARIRELAENFGAPILRPRTGDVWDYDGMKIRVLFTPEECYDRLTDPNELSLIFEVIGNKKKAMFTGDSYERGAKICAYRYWKDMKSDYCQLAHHGLNGGAVEFYACVDAPTVLIPISVAGDRDVATWKPGTCPRQFAERLAERVCKSYEGDVLFSL